MMTQVGIRISSFCFFFFLYIERASDRRKFLSLNVNTESNSLHGVLFLAASGPVRLFTPYKRRRRHQTDLEVVSGIGSSVSGIAGLLTVNSSAGTSSCVAGGGVAGPKKKRTNVQTEDESETDQQIVVTKEEDPWSLADHIDASSDYIESHIATGEC